MVKKAEFVISSPDVMQCPQTTLPEYAFIGRSNVGKSSLINMLCHDPKLAKTSQKPGKTLLINHFLVQSTDRSAVGPQSCKTAKAARPASPIGEWYIVDLPGYGYAQASQKQRENLRKMIERYCLLRQQLCNLFVLVDSRHAPQKIDLEFMNWLGEQQIPFSIVFTKADKQGRMKLQENVEAYKQVLLETWEELPPIFVTSAEKKEGGEELLAYIDEINRSIAEGE